MISFSLLPFALLLFQSLSGVTTTPLPPPAPHLMGQTPDEFAVRREKVRVAAGGAIVLLVTPPHDEEGEHIRPRGDNSLVYLTGLDEPGTCLALLPENDPSGVREILFVGERPTYQLRYVGAKPGIGELEQQTGIRAVKLLRDLWSTLAPSLQAAKTVRIFGATDLASLYPENAGLMTRLSAQYPRLQITGNAEQLLAPLRRIKSPGEIENMRTAIKATLEAEKSVARRIRPGITELAIEGVILSAFRANDCFSEAFPSVVGAGPNSTILHHYSDPRPMKSRETVVVDIGAEYHQYAADVTRTFPVNGKFTPRQREVYQLVLDTQQFCERSFVPGKTTMSELNRSARAYLKKSSLRWKDASGTVQTMDRAFWHGLGHLVGLDVHDVGDSGREPLTPGMVFTIEPGIYLPNENFGVRIEDDYLVTEKGLEKLSRAFPSRPEEIEATMQPPRPILQTRKRKMVYNKERMK